MNKLVSISKLKYPIIIDIIKDIICDFPKISLPKKYPNNEEANSIVIRLIPRPKPSAISYLKLIFYF